MNATASSLDVSFHEACHAASLLLAGIPVAYARVDAPRRGVLGSVAVDWTRATPDNDTLTAMVMATVCGALAEGFEPEALDWPIQPGNWPAANGADVEQIMHLAHVLNLDQVDFGWLCFRAQQMSRTRLYQEMVKAITRQLLALELVVRHELEQIRDQVLAEFG